MNGDPIVAEVRAIRDKLAAECGHDIGEIFRRLRDQQAGSDLNYVRYPPRRVPPTGYDTAAGSKGSRPESQPQSGE